MNGFNEFLSKGLVFGNHKVTISDILMIIIIFLVVRLLVAVINHLIQRSLKHRPSDQGRGYTFTKLASYILYTIAFVLGLEIAGVDVTILIASSAALLVGVGLGIQHIFNDIVSGFVILFEGAVRVGDVIELDGTIARVESISIRTSAVITRKGNVIIVPNSKITSDAMLNWSHGDLISRHDIAVGVAYGSDTDLVAKTLRSVLEGKNYVVPGRPIHVVFQDFGDSALNFELRFWAEKSWEMDLFKSDVRYSIDAAFRKEGIKIPFPQRDVHVVSTSANL